MFHNVIRQNIPDDMAKALGGYVTAGANHSFPTRPPGSPFVEVLAISEGWPLVRVDMVQEFILQNMAA